jgi:hypothetical protein
MPAGGLHEQDCLPEARVRNRGRRISPGGCALRDHRRSRLGLSNMQHGRPWRSVASALAQLRTASSAARVNRLSWYITPILWSGLSVSMMSLLWVCRSVVDTFPRATSPTAGPTVPPCRCVSCPGRPHGKPTQVHVHDQEPPRPPGIVCGDSRVRRLGASVTRPGVVEGPRLSPSSVLSLRSRLKRPLLMRAGNVWVTEALSCPMLPLAVSRGCLRGGIAPAIA